MFPNHNIKTKLTLSFCVLTIGFVLPCCLYNHWTEKQRKEFKSKCMQTETFNNFIVRFKGFGNNEFDSILVKEFKDTTLLDSFKVFVSPSDNHPLNKGYRHATIERTMNIHHKYQFIIPGQKPYELANMKMIMWARFTMTSEGYGCVMGDYTIDGVRFEHSANPTFVKRLDIEIK